MNLYYCSFIIKEFCILLPTNYLVKAPYKTILFIFLVNICIENNIVLVRIKGLLQVISLIHSRFIHRFLQITHNMFKGFTTPKTYHPASVQVRHGKLSGEKTHQLSLHFN